MGRNLSFLYKKYDVSSIYVLSNVIMRSRNVKPLSQLCCDQFPTACDRSQGIVRRSHGACDRFRVLNMFKKQLRSLATDFDRSGVVRPLHDRSYDRLEVVQHSHDRSVVQHSHDRSVVQRYDRCTIARRSHYWRTTVARPWDCCAILSKKNRSYQSLTWERRMAASVARLLF